MLHRARFWAAHADASFNERQRKLLLRLLEGFDGKLTSLLLRLLEGFDGKLTSSKWVKIAGCSQDTAHRDILDPVARGVLAKDAVGGRSTSYSLAEPLVGPDCSR